MRVTRALLFGAVIAIAVLCATAVFVSAEGIRADRRRAGGFGDDKKPDSDVAAAVTAVRADIIKRLGEQYHFDNVQDIEIVSYKTQVVAGLNYRVTATATDANGEVITNFEATIYRSLPIPDFTYQLNSLEVNVAGESAKRV